MKKHLLILTLAMIPFFTAKTQEVQEVADADIDTAIETSLWTDDAVTANAIEVSTANGVVNLSGTVNSILAKERTEKIAGATVGVRAIVNRITVEPETAREDEDLAQAVEDAWLRDPAVHAWTLTAAADEGEVTLSGTVDSYAKKDLAARIAKGVRGVTAIENDVSVDFDSARTDTEILEEVKARIENDIRIDDALMEVSVVDGHVLLSGSVGSLAEKNEARDLAWVSGVRTVRAGDLQISEVARDEMRRTDIQRSLEDEAVQKNVEDALTYDPRVLAFDIDVAVQNRTVSLRGEVDNLAAKRAAEQTARNTMGVQSVNNYIHVRTDIPSDEELESRVETALIADPMVNRYAITVSAESGWVYLSGDVNTSAQKERARAVAERQIGVLSVVNTIEYDYYWVWKPDWEIRQDVNNRLKWSPFVQESNVEVSVENGVVTLTGTVYSLTEKNEARKNAFQGGAKDVENRLKVEHLFYGPYSPYYYGAAYRYGAGW